MFDVLKKNYQNKTWVTLDKIQHALGWTTLELADRLKLTEKRFNFHRARGLEPSLYSVSQLIEQIGLSVEKVVTGDIDYQVLKSHTKGDLFHIPEKYLHSAFSKRRTSIHLLDYIEIYFGWEMKKRILNHFQITEAILKDPDAEINILFITDFCQHFIRSGYSPALLPLMGAHSVVTNKNTPHGKLMASFGSPKNLHEQLIVNYVGKTYDRNFNYRIKSLSDEMCVVETTITQELQDSLKRKIVGSSHNCLLRAGSFSSLTGYLNLPFSSVVEESCIFRGDACCRYRISFQSAHSIYLSLN